MIRFFILKFKSGFYIGLLAILNLAAILITPACNNSENKNGKNTEDSLKNVKRINDSIAKEKLMNDSILNEKQVKDSIFKSDSIKKIKPRYEHKIQNTKYGVIRTDYKEM